MGDEEEPPAPPKLPTALIVVTSCVTLPNESATGYYLSEVAHPYNEFKKHGWEVEFASITGEARADPASVAGADSESKTFYEDEVIMPTVANAKAIAEIPVEDAMAKYECLYFAGGFGAAVDFPNCEEAKTLIKAFLEAGEETKKVVAAVCHGPLVLANVLNADETKLLADKVCTGFSDAEEVKMGMKEVMSTEGGGPGTCQELFTSAGAKYQVGLPFEPLVCCSGPLMTGQNPASAAPLATSVVYYFDPIKAEFEPKRLAMLKAREALVAEITTMEKQYEEKLAALKKQETAGGAVADKIEELVALTQAGAAYRAASLTDLDAQLARNAALRQAALDAKAAAEAAAAAEE